MAVANKHQLALLSAAALCVTLASYLSDDNIMQNHGDRVVSIGGVPVHNYHLRRDFRDLIGDTPARGLRGKGVHASTRLLNASAWEVRASTWEVNESFSEVNSSAQAVNASALCVYDWILEFKDTVTDIYLHNLCTSLPGYAQCTWEGHPSEGGLPMVVLRATESDLEASLATHGELLDHAEPDIIMKLADDLPWGLDRIDDRFGLDGSYEIDASGAGVHVYVADSGIRTTHDEFKASHFYLAAPAQLCDSGDEVSDFSTCLQAYLYLNSRHNFEYPNRRDIVSSSGGWAGVPRHCSLQVQGVFVTQNRDMSPHWSGARTSTNTRMPEFRSICVRQRALRTVDFTHDNGGTVCQTSDPSCASDQNGHGTHVAGTIGGNRYGVATGATLHSVKVCTATGSCPNKWILQSLDWVAINGKRPAVYSASIGNIRIGNARFQNGMLHAGARAVQRAVEAGVTAVIAAGNLNDDACEYAWAHAPHAITVGASQLTRCHQSWCRRVMPGNRDTIWSNSNYGRCIDIFAPGVDILSASVNSDSASKLKSGTSMATPHVSGAAALLLEKRPTLTPAEIADQLRYNMATLNVLRDTKNSDNLLLHVGDAPRTPNASGVSGWRIMTQDSSSGFAWDVRRVKFLTLQGEEYPMSNCNIITSRDCCNGYEGSNAFRDDRSWWGGRKERTWNPFDTEFFFIGLECNVPEMHVVKVQILQNGISSVHFANADVSVQTRCNSGSWRTVALVQGLLKDNMQTIFDGTPTLHGGCCQRTAWNDACAFLEYDNDTCNILSGRSISCGREKERAVWAPHKTYDAHSGRCIDLLDGPRRLSDSSRVLV